METENENKSVKKVYKLIRLAINNKVDSLISFLYINVD